MKMSIKECKKNSSINSDQSNNKGVIDFDVHDTFFLRGRELNKSQQNVYQFLKENRVEETFNFLIEHLLVNTPRDPLKFLVDLLDKCINFRDNLKDPPLLFDRSHQEIIYKAFDPGNRGFINESQYCAAMKTVGLENVNHLLPSKRKNGKISKKEFLNEMDSALINHLFSMLGGVSSDEDIPTVVRGSLLRDGKHRLGSADSSSLLLIGARKSSVRFFLEMDEGLDEFGSPTTISHTEFFEHISQKSSKFPSGVQKMPNYDEQVSNLAEDDSLESVNESNFEETEYFMNKKLMERNSVEEIMSVKGLTLAEDKEKSIKSFQSFENIKKEEEEIPQIYKLKDNERRSSGLKNQRFEENVSSKSKEGISFVSWESSDPRNGESKFEEERSLKSKEDNSFVSRKS